ncbi:MAG: nitroreductase family protein [Clostridiales Family XIII bacterium]|jgi:nitroreductase|nr:nitroreductase family protein [Clostridiales Family XIII bacterium]
MANGTIEALKTRRSIRSFADEQLSREVLDEILEAATYAPSGRGLQNPLIVVVQKKETLDRLRKMNAEVLGMDIDPYYGAPTIVLVFSPTDGATYVEDASSVLTYMSVAAHALDAASCWINRERQMFDSAEGQEMKKSWGIPEKYVGIGALAIGIGQGDVPAPAPRKPDYIRWVE